MKKPSRFALRPYYLMRPRLWGEDLRIIDQRTFVSRRWKYIYVRIPKAANSSVMTALLTRFPEDRIDPENIDRAKRKVLHLHNLGVVDLRRAGQYFTFTVVRHPFARILSAYLDKMRAGDKHLDRFGERIARYDNGRMSFPGFCRYLADGGEAENAHWMRQSRIVSAVDRLDFTGRVETLEADLGSLVGHISGQPESIEVGHKGPPPTGADARLGSYYDEECLRLIAETYRTDFQRFGYTADIASEARSPP